jgi:DNA-binding NarL/FixJ family response regulator
MSPGITVILADDHEILRQGLRSLLTKERDIHVVAEGSTGHEAVTLAKKHKPDVVIMDISMPDLNGIEATRRILRDLPKTRVIALSMHSDRQFVERMLSAGARGYVLKQGALEELVNAIRIVMTDSTYLGKRVEGLAVGARVRSDENSPAVSSQLTDKEREVLQLVVEGYSSKQIAVKINAALKTVEKHRQHIMEKLDLWNIPDLTKYAIREGITSLEK